MAPKVQKTGRRRLPFRGTSPCGNDAEGCADRSRQLVPPSRTYALPSDRDCDSARWLAWCTQQTRSAQGARRTRHQVSEEHQLLFCFPLPKNTEPEESRRRDSWVHAVQPGRSKRLRHSYLWSTRRRSSGSPPNPQQPTRTEDSQGPW